MRVGRILLFTALATVFATVAFAQSRRNAGGPVPAPGMLAVGGSIGVGLPTEPSFTNGLDLAANVESYLTRRVSLRAQVSGAFWDITGRGFSGTVRPVAIDGNVVYNFEGGAIHPFITGGVGLYHYRFTETPVSGSTNKVGLDLGGGVEYFFTRHATGTAEVLFHDTAGPLSSPVTTFTDSSYWTMTFGLKQYF